MILLCTILVTVTVIGVCRGCNRPAADPEELEEIMSRMDSAMSVTAEEPGDREKNE